MAAILPVAVSVGSERFPTMGAYEMIDGSLLDSVRVFVPPLNILVFNESTSLI